MAMSFYPNHSLCIIVCQFVIGMAQADPDNLSGCLSNFGGYATSFGCFLQNGENKPLRVVYLDKQYVTQNQAAIDSATARGMKYTFSQTCESTATAVPEWCLHAFCWGLFLSLSFGDFAVLWLKTGSKDGWANLCGECFQSI